MMYDDQVSIAFPNSVNFGPPAELLQLVSLHTHLSLSMYLKRAY